MISMPERYQVIRIDKKGYGWKWYKDLPYKSLGLMCWDDVKNCFCEVGWDLETKVWDCVIIDWQTGKHGNLYIISKIANYRRVTKYFVWWWYPQYGSDKNPHIEKAEWIEFGG